MRLSFRISKTGIAAAIGAGLAGVLLSMLTLERPPVTLAMGFVAPLPLMIAAIGFGPAAGALATVVGVIVVGLFDMRLGRLVVAGFQSPGNAGLDILVFLLALGLPSLLLAVVASTPPTTAATIPRDRPEERLLGRATSIAVGFAAVSVSTVFVIAIVSNGGYDAFNAILKDAFEKVWDVVAERRQLPKGLDAAKLAQQLTWLMPPMMSASAVLFYAVNLWLAARIAQMSDLLAVPWPDIPRNMRMPRIAAVVLAVSLGLSFTGAIPGLVSRTVSAALIAAFSIQGLAVIHAITRGKTTRTATLIIVYLSMAALPWPLLFWGALGLLDTAFSFRDRQKPAVPRKP